MPDDKVKQYLNQNNKSQIINDK